MNQQLKLLYFQSMLKEELILSNTFEDLQNALHVKLTREVLRQILYLLMLVPEFHYPFLHLDLHLLCLV